MINLLWLLAIAVACYFQSVVGLLGLMAVFAMEIAIEVKLLRVHAGTLAQVFTDPAPVMPPERDEAIAAAVLQRIQQEAAGIVGRGPVRWH